MTILNIHVEPARVLFGTDSHVQSADPADTVQWRTTKVFPLPHIDAVFGGRGPLNVIVGVLSALVTDPAASFDSLADRLPAKADMVMNLAANTAGAAVRPKMFDAMLALAGWSTTAGRFVGHYWLRSGENSPLVRHDIAPELVVPWDPSIRSAPSPSSAEAMEKLAVAQQGLLARKCGPGVAGSGPFFFGELTRGAVSIRKLLDLPRHA